MAVRAGYDRSAIYQLDILRTDCASAGLALHRVHLYIARNLLHQDPRNCNFYGNKEVGAFLYKLMKAGATRDWRQLIREATGEDLSAKAMLEYYQPLMKYLQEQNRGHTVGW